MSEKDKDSGSGNENPTTDGGVGASSKDNSSSGSGGGSSSNKARRTIDPNRNADAEIYDVDFWRDRILDNMKGKTNPKDYPTAAQMVRDIRMVKTKNPSQYDLDTATERLKRIIREIRYFDPRFNVWTDYNRSQRQWTVVKADESDDNIYWMRNRARRAAKTCAANRKQVWVFVEHLRAYMEDHPDEADDLRDIIDQIIGEANQGVQETS